MGTIITFLSHPVLSGIAAICSIILFFLSFSKSKFWYLFAFCIILWCGNFTLGTILPQDKVPDVYSLLEIGKVIEIKSGYLVFTSKAVMPQNPKLYVRVKNNDIIQIKLSKQQDNLFSAIVPKRIYEINKDDMVLISK